MSKGLISIPTYNEIENIRALMGQIFEAHPDMNVLIIDDNSPDGTGDLVAELQKQDARIHLIRREKKLGIGSAHTQAFKFAIEKKVPYVIQMDADYSHHPRYLAPMIDQLASHDLVIGSRYISGGETANWGIFRKLMSWGGNFYCRLILGRWIHDWTGGMNGWKTEKLATLPLDDVRSEGYSFQIEMKYLAQMHGFKKKEFPIIFEDRTLGKSKMSKAIFLEAVYRVWQLRCRQLFRKWISQKDAFHSA